MPPGELAVNHLDAAFDDAVALVGVKARGFGGRRRPPLRWPCIASGGPTKITALPGHDHRQVEPTGPGSNRGRSPIIIWPRPVYRR